MPDVDTFERRFENGSLHLSEWESLEVDNYDNFKRLQNAISPKEGDKCKELSVYDYGGAKIKASYYVGAMGFETPVEVNVNAIEQQLEQVIITPKICDYKGDWVDFIWMLEIAYGFKLPDIKEEPKLKGVNDLRLILVWIYLRSVEQLLKKHLRRNYVIRVDNLNGRVKGKLLLTPYVRQQVAKGQPQIAVCQYYELTPDTLLNRIIKAGLRSAKRLVAAADTYNTFSGVSGHLTRQIGLFGNVADVRVTRADFARIRLHAQNRYYETPLQLAKMLLFDNRFEYEIGKNRVVGFFLDMNNLFERFVAGLLMQGAHRNGVTYPGKGEFRYYYGNRDTKGTVKLKPDITIDTDGEKVVIDAKYKELFEENFGVDEEIETGDDYGDVKVKIKSSDIYQLVAYLDNFGSRRGALVYPRNGSETSVINVDGFGDKDIKILGVGLSYEEGLGEKGAELEEKLLRA